MAHILRITARSSGSGTTEPQSLCDYSPTKDETPKMLHSITPRRALLLLPVAVICFGAAALHQDGDWKVHDMDRPQPSTVTAGAPSCDGTVGSAPSDAIAPL